MKISILSAPSSNRSSNVSTAVPVISVLQGIVEIYGFPQIDEKIHDVEQVEQSAKLSVLSAIQTFQTKRDDHSKNHLIKILQEEYITKKQERDNAIKKRDYYLSKVKKAQKKDTRPSKILTSWRQSLSHTVSAFFETTDAQLATKYDSIVKEYTQHRSALARSISELQDMPPAESELSEELSVAESTPPPFPAKITLSTLNNELGFAIDGESLQDNLGYSASAGDIDGDGYSDILTAAPYHNSHTGTAYVVWGSKNIGKNGNVALSDLDETTGLKMPGETPYGQSTGKSVSIIKDINNDDLPELLIGAEGYNANTGRTYLIFGGRPGIAGQLPLASLNSSTGIKIDGENRGDFAGTVGDAGDINGDSHNDFFVGAPGYNQVSGRSYAVFGGPTLGSIGQLLLANLIGNNGYKADSGAINSYSGYPVKGIGDFNGDRLDDYAIGAPFFNANTGSIYIVYGGYNVGSGGLLSLDNLDGRTGTRIDGVNPGDYTGWSFSATDFNKDGIADLIIGSPFFNKTGCIHIVHGGSNMGAGGRISLGEPNDKIIRIVGESPGDNFGFAVSALGDVDGRGHPDLIIGASNHNASRGRSYVVFSEGGLSSQLQLSSLDGSTGFVVDGEEPNDLSGYTVGDGKDINGDKGADILIGAPGYNKVGRLYTLFGVPNSTHPTPPHSSPDLRWLWLLVFLGTLPFVYWKRREIKNTINLLVASICQTSPPLLETTASRPKSSSRSNIDLEETKREESDKDEQQDDKKKETPPEESNQPQIQSSASTPSAAFMPPPRKSSQEEIELQPTPATGPRPASDYGSINNSSSSSSSATSASYS